MRPLLLSTFLIYNGIGTAILKHPAHSSFSATSGGLSFLVGRSDVLAHSEAVYVNVHEERKIAPHPHCCRAQPDTPSGGPERQEIIAHMTVNGYMSEKSFQYNAILTL